MLDLSRIENLRERGDKWVGQCPACSEMGRDRKGEHLFVHKNGRFGCVQYPGNGGKGHRKRIAQLVGVPGSRRSQSRNKRVTDRNGANTLDGIIRSFETKLAMRSTRRDTYHDQHGRDLFLIVRFE